MTAPSPASAAVPLLILTGFLGAGKTTLLNQLLDNSFGVRVGALVNEFGSVDVDSRLLREQAAVRGAQMASVSVVELPNGCVCCSIAADLRGALIAILNAGLPDKGVDQIVIETSGVTDPVALVTQLMAPLGGLASLPGPRRAWLAGVVTVIDADSFTPEMASRGAPCAQLAAADLLVLSKCDLLFPWSRVESIQTQVATAAAQARTRVTYGDAAVADAARVGPAPRILLCRRGAAPVATILHVSSGGDGNNGRGLPPPPPPPRTPPPNEGNEYCSPRHGHGHSHSHGGNDDGPCGDGCTVDEDVGPPPLSHHLAVDGLVSVSVTVATPLSLAKLQQWAVRCIPSGAIRVKGFLTLHGDAPSRRDQLVLQLSGRRRLHVDRLATAGDAGDGTHPMSPPPSSLVFIGTGLDEVAIRADLTSCCADLTEKDGDESDAVARANGLRSLLAADARFAVSPVSPAACVVDVRVVGSEFHAIAGDDLTAALIAEINARGALFVTPARNEADGPLYARHDAGDATPPSAVAAAVQAAAVDVLTRAFFEHFCC